MIVFQILFFYWSLFNVPIGAIAIVANCISNSEYDKRNLLFWPLLISYLREKLNKAGTVIATIFISIFFAPAIIVYFVAGSFVGLIYLVCMGFCKLFKRKD